MRTDTVTGDTTRYHDLRRRARRCTCSIRRRRKRTCSTCSSSATTCPRRRCQRDQGVVQGQRPDQADRGQDRHRFRHGSQRAGARWAARAGHDDDGHPVGPVWIVKGAPGAADYLGVLQGAVEKGLIFSDPRAQRRTGTGQGDGRDVSPAGRDRRHPVRDGNEHQDGRRRPDGGHDREDGRHLDDHDRQCGGNRRDRRRPVRGRRPATSSRSRSTACLPTSRCSRASPQASSPSSFVRRGRSSRRPKAWTRGSTPTTRSDR